MTYKYFEEIEKGFRDFSIVNTENKNYDMEKYFIRLRPIYFNEFGNLFYDKNSHIGSNIRFHAEGIFKLFIYELRRHYTLNPKRLDFAELFSNLKLSRFKDLSKLSMLDVRNFINYSPEPYYDDLLFLNKSSDIFTEDVMVICNSIKESFYEVSRKLFYLASTSGDTNLLAQNILKLFHISVDETFFSDYKVNSFLDSGYRNTFKLERSINQIIDDLLLFYIGLDKIETSRKRCITTTKRNINEVFFNYLIMDFTIERMPSLIYNKEEETLEFNKLSLFDYGVEREYEEEIKLIRRLVKPDDRYKYFR